MNLEVRVDHNFREVERDLETLPGRIDEAIYSGVLEATHIVAEAYRQDINRKTGATAETISEQVERILNGAEGHVGSDSDIAKYLEYGTEPHIIRPRYGKALHFVVDGRDIFVTEVHHPGTPEYRPLLRATDETEEFVIQTIEQKVGDVLGNAGNRP